MCSVRGRKGVIDIKVAERGEALGELAIVFLLALVIPDVLEHGDLAGLKRIDHALRVIARRSGGEADRDPRHQLLHLGSDRTERSVRSRLALGAPEMGQNHDPTSLARNLSDGRQDAGQSGRVGNDPVLDRHVEVDADQHALALNIDSIDRPYAGEIEAVLARIRLSSRRTHFVHISRPMAAAVSFMRLEKPHSLSYQATTRQNVPSTT